jgi:hypothetical protein
MGERRRSSHRKLARCAPLRIFVDVVARRHPSAMEVA